MQMARPFGEQTNVLCQGQQADGDGVAHELARVSEGRRSVLVYLCADYKGASGASLVRNGHIWRACGTFTSEATGMRRTGTRRVPNDALAAACVRHSPDTGSASWT